MNILRKIADLIGRIPRPFRREPPPRVALFVADDNQVYLAVVSGGAPLATLARTSAGPCAMRFTRV